MNLVIVGSGGANIASLQAALDRLDCAATLSTDADTIRAASHVILPGVGAAADAMARLRELALDTVLRDLEQPVLGICLGMQLLADASEEDGAACLGLTKDRARLIRSAPERPVPHMGWNTVAATRASPLFEGIPDGSHFYFVHSYALPVSDATIARCEYGESFAAAIQRGNYFGTQFHPERSAKAGARLLANFLALDA
ncbi:MAG: imidazole glycerol phosphate synthase subunit HisH [Pseudomonadota bacterium]